MLQQNGLEKTPPRWWPWAHGAEPTQKEPTLRELLEAAITRARNRGRASIRNMEWTASALMNGISPNTVASEVTGAVVERYISVKLAAGWKPASVNRTLALLRRAFNIAYKSRMVARALDIELLAENNIRQTMPSAAEYLAIREQLGKIGRQVPGTLPRLLDFYYVTGYRSREPLKLTWECVDRTAGVLQLAKYATKSKQWRAAWPYSKHPILRDVIEEQWKAKQETERERSMIITHVFFRKDGKPIRSFRRAWVQAREAIGRPDLWVHDFRRVAYRDLIKSGTDAKTARKLIGAKTASIGDRYHIVTDEDTAEAAEKLAAFHAAQRGEVEGRFVSRPTPGGRPSRSKAKRPRRAANGPDSPPGAARDRQP